MSTRSRRIWDPIPWKTLVYLIGVAAILISCAVAVADMSDAPNLPPSAQKPSSFYTPPAGMVPDNETAVRIAEAVWLPIYGEEVLEKRPFEAELVGDTVWVVAGTLPKKYTLGGVPYIEIQKKDGRILAVGHSK